MYLIPTQSKGAHWVKPSEMQFENIDYSKPRKQWDVFYITGGFLIKDSLNSKSTAASVKVCQQGSPLHYNLETNDPNYFLFP